MEIDWAFYGRIALLAIIIFVVASQVLSEYDPLSTRIKLVVIVCLIYILFEKFPKFTISFRNVVCDAIPEGEVEIGLPSFSTGSVFPTATSYSKDMATARMEAAATEAAKAPEEMTEAEMLRRLEEQQRKYLARYL
jgi:hypothetical protein